jgi:hypothetical protein
MKNLRRLSKKDLRTVNGGNAPLCESGYRACVTARDENGSPIWDCIASQFPCRP